MIWEKMKEYQELYGISGEAEQLTPASCLQAEKCFWESCHPSTTSDAPVSRILPLILPIHGRSWRDENVKIPTKALKRIKAHLAKTKEKVTHVRQSIISGHGLFASKCFNRYVSEVLVCAIMSLTYMEINNNILLTLAASLCRGELICEIAGMRLSLPEMIAVRKEYRRSGLTEVSYTTRRAKSNNAVLHWT